MDVTDLYQTHWGLTFLIVFPLLAAAAAYLAGEGSAKTGALGAGLVEVLVSLPLFWAVGTAAAICQMSGTQGVGQVGQVAVPMQNCADFAWFPDWGIHYRIGGDGISLFMVLLTTLLLPLISLGWGRYVR